MEIFYLPGLVNDEIWPNYTFQVALKFLLYLRILITLVSWMIKLVKSRNFDSDLKFLTTPGPVNDEIRPNQEILSCIEILTQI